MHRTYNWSRVEAQVADTIAVWNSSAAKPTPDGPQYCPKEQSKREKAYDKALRSVERETRSAPRTKVERLQAQNRITASFGRFAAAALDLEEDAVRLLTDDFLPVGTKLAQWARQFDPDLSMADITQACRNAWTACGLQPLLGERVELTPSILGYSLLYPYTDNYLDQGDISEEAKHRFSESFRDRLRGESVSPRDSRESALWDLVQLIEGQYPRRSCPQVYDCLLAIHRAQEESIAQLSNKGPCSDDEVLRMSCAKGGTSVLVDACLARGWLSPQENRFAFEWGVLLQLGDDLQDVREDLARGSVTLFSRAAALGTPLDSLATQLLNFSEQVGTRMDDLPYGEATLKELLRMSWRSLIVGAVADSHQFFTTKFLEEMERTSPFRFEFLRARRDRLSSRQGLYATLFDAFLEDPEDGDTRLPLPTRGPRSWTAPESGDSQDSRVGANLPLAALQP
jgi:hypothetical protein